MSSLTFSARDFPSVDAVLAQLERRATDTSPLMDRIGQAIESSTIERFNDERAPDGSKWKPSIRARVEGGKTLTKSARLKGSITHNFSVRETEVGTNAIYGKIHQDGGVITAKSGDKLKFRLPGNLGFRTMERVTMPARPFLGISDDDQREVASQVEDFLSEVLP